MEAISFEDATRELPDYDEWLRAQDPEQEEQPTRRRITRKRPIIEEGVDEEMEGAPAPRPGAIPRTREALSTDTTEIGHCWWHDVAAHSWGDKGEWWQSTDAAVEVQVELPESSRGFKKAMVNMSGFFVGALKKRAVEVCERRLSEQEKQEFRQAKLSEVKNFIAAEAFEALPEQLKPDRNTAINMRWVLTWKQLDTGGRKAKARAVLLGYQDPAYEHRATTSPVMSRQTRQCFLQMCANKKWRVYKGDVSGAFLQGRPYAGGLLCIPCDEICEAMGLAKGSVTRLKKACYGLVDAPLEWYKTVSEFLQTLGLERAWSDPCLWLWRPQGVLRGLVSGHVDDFLFGGSEEDSLWQEILNKIKQKFKWGDWEHGEFHSVWGTSPSNGPRFRIESDSICGGPPSGDSSKWDSPSRQRSRDNRKREDTAKGHPGSPVVARSTGCPTRGSRNQFASLRGQPELCEHYHQDESSGFPH